MIVKIDSQGEEYKMCAKSVECKCIVECEKSNDCENGMDCVEYKCIENDNDKKKRKEGVERKVVPIVITIPLSICVFGIFTSMYLAREYSENFFDDEICEYECPPSQIHIDNRMEVDISIEELSKSKKSLYKCKGACEVNEEKFYFDIHEELDNIEDKYQHHFESSEGLYEELVLVLYQENMFGCDDMCHSTSVLSDVVAMSIREAISVFSAKAQVDCEFHEYQWVNKGEVEGGGTMYSIFHDLGKLKGLCNVEVSSIRCIESVETVESVPN